MFTIKRGTRRHWGHLQIYREQRPKTRERDSHANLHDPGLEEKKSGWSNWNLRGGLKNKHPRHWRLANPLYPPGTVWKSYKRVPRIVGATSTKSTPTQYAILAICYDMLALVTENLWSDLIGNNHPLYCYASGPYEKQKIKTADILSGGTYICQMQHHTIKLKAQHRRNDHILGHIFRKWNHTMLQQLAKIIRHSVTSRK